MDCLRVCTRRTLLSTLYGLKPLPRAEVNSIWAPQNTTQIIIDGFIPPSFDIQSLSVSPSRHGIYVQQKIPILRPPPQRRGAPLSSDPPRLCTSQISPKGDGVNRSSIGTCLMCSMRWCMEWLVYLQHILVMLSI